jgi:glutaredoxin 3
MITMYSKDNCPWCEKALELLKKYDKPVKVLKLGVDFTREEFYHLVDRRNKPRTVPQIVIGHDWIGGYEDLVRYVDNEDWLIGGLPKIWKGK